MPDLDRALVDISVIREHLARGSEFRGYGPITVGMTGILALLTAVVQHYRLADSASAPERYLHLWGVAAAVSFGLIVTEAVFRSRRAHGGMALSMLQKALEQFLPAIVAGALLTVILPSVAPATVWMLPGLWQIIYSLGVFASSCLLPRATFAVGVWYLCCGLSCLALMGPHGSLSPWAMGVPFGVGQWLVAAILLRANEDRENCASP
jgi:hypothetical protein